MHMESRKSTYVLNTFRNHKMRKLQRGINLKCLILLVCCFVIFVECTSLGLTKCSSTGCIIGKQSHRVSHGCFCSAPCYIHALMLMYFSFCLLVIHLCKEPLQMFIYEKYPERKWMLISSVMSFETHEFLTSVKQKRRSSLACLRISFS